MNTRLKILRKSLNLTQNNFGKQIGLKGNSVSEIEKGKKNLTDRNISIICKEFNVNEEWLRTGKGEMINHDEESELAYLLGSFAASENNAKKKLVKYIINLDDDKFNNTLKQLTSLIDMLNSFDNKK